MTENSHESKVFRIRLDPTIIGYRGPLIVNEIDNRLFMYKENLPVFNTPDIIVSHEGDSDISLFLSRYISYLGIYAACLVVIFSFREINRFRKEIAKNARTGLTRIPDLKQPIIEDDISIKKAGMMITPSTVYFSPNSYIFLATGDLQIYFGRKMGIIDGKQASLFSYSAIIPGDRIASVSNAIEKNITRFEEKHSIKIDQYFEPKSNNET